MAFAISDIQSQLQYGGARPSLFQVNILNPLDGRGQIKQPFMIMAASIPDSTVGAIPVPYFGRTINVAGVRQYQQWQVEVINDEDFLVRAGFEAWVGKINTPVTNIRATGTSAPAAYKSRGQVLQYSQVGQVIKTYHFEGLFPVQVGGIQLSWQAGNQIETFPVTFVLDEFTIEGEIE